MKARAIRAGIDVDRVDPRSAVYALQEVCLALKYLKDHLHRIISPEQDEVADEAMRTIERMVGDAKFDLRQMGVGGIRGSDGRVRPGGFRSEEAIKISSLTGKNAWGRKGMLSQIPIDLDKVSPERLDMEILRAAIIAEWDAVNLYEQMEEMAEEPAVRAVLLDVAAEEKVHVGEFCAVLEAMDPEGAEDIMEGFEEADDLIGEPPPEE